VILSSFLTKGMVVGRGDVFPIIAFPALIVAWATSFRGVAMFPLFAESGIPLSIIQFLPLGFAPGALVGGFLLDKIRRRKPFFFLFFLWGAVSFLPVFSTSSAIVPVYVFATGILQGILVAPTYSSLADISKTRERGRVSGAAWTVAMSFSLLALLALSVSLSTYFILLGSIAILLGILGVTQKEKINVNDWRNLTARNAFLNQNLLILGLLRVAVGFFWVTNTILIARYAAVIIPEPRLTFWIVIVAVEGASAFFVGVMADRIGRRPTIGLGVLIYTSSFMLYIIYNEYSTFFIVAGFFGLGYAITWITIAFVMPGDLAVKESRGRFYGTLGASTAVGGFTGATVATLLASSPVTIIMAFTIFSAFLIILPTALVKETLPPPEKVQEMNDYIREIEDIVNQ